MNDGNRYIHLCPRFFWLLEVLKKVDWIISLTFSVIQRWCPPLYSGRGSLQRWGWIDKTSAIILTNCSSCFEQYNFSAKHVSSLIWVVSSLRLNLQECLIMAQQIPNRAWDYNDHPRIPRWPRESNKIKTFHELYIPCHDCLLSQPTISSNASGMTNEVGVR